MAELTVEEIEWIKKQKAIKEKEEELTTSNENFDNLIRNVRTQATIDINALETQKIDAATVLESEIENLEKVIL